MAYCNPVATTDSDDYDFGGEQGRVEKVSRQWLVYEDGALAERLQSEEFNEHFDRNRFDRNVSRIDTSKARTAQEEEEEEATRKLIEQHEQLLKLEQEDERLAHEMYEKMKMEECSVQRSVEEKDMEMARKLQEKEERRYQRFMEKKKAHTELKQRQKELAEQRKKLEAEISQRDQATQREGDSSARQSYQEVKDFNSVMLPHVTEEQRRKLQEREDQMLAKLLHEEESKNTKQSAADIEQETKDMELAKIIQEQEIVKAKRRKEKRRQHHQHHQDEQEQEEHEHHSHHSHYSHHHHHHHHPESDEGSPPQQVELRDDDVESVRQPHAVELPPRRSLSHPPISEHLSTPAGEVPNILLQIDPTYNRTGASSHHSLSPQRAGGPVSPRGALSGEDFRMVAGQRRTHSFDKDRSKRHAK